MKKILIILTLGYFLIGCKKNDNVIDKFQSPVSWMASNIFSNSDSAYNWVVIYSNQSIYKYDSSFTTRLLASFMDSATNKPAGVNSLYLNGTLMTRNADSTYSNLLSDSSGVSYPAHTVNIKIRGTTVNDTLTKSIYIPKKMILKTADYPFAYFDAYSNFTVKWSTDSYSPGDSVVIFISYLPNESIYRHPGLPTNINPLLYVVPDNGSFTISSSALSVFPLHSVIQIEIGRGTQVIATLPVSHRKIQYYGVSEAFTIPLQVELPF
jgi:hypothetical protein